MVVSQVKGYDATAAHDDWFKYQKDAENVAQQLANESWLVLILFNSDTMELLRKTIIALGKIYSDEKEFLNETWVMAREEEQDTSSSQASSLAFNELREKFGEQVVTTAMRS